MRDGTETPRPCDDADRPDGDCAGSHDRPQTIQGRTRGDPCTRIVRAVAAVTGTRPVELPPLSESIDPDALRRLAADADPAADLRVSFDYADCGVSITGAGELLVRGPGSDE